MFPFFCLRCSEISISDERLRCSNCESDESRNTVTDNFNLPVSEREIVSPGHNVPATDAGNLKSEEYFMVGEPTREVNNQTFEENSNFPLQIAGFRGYENCLKSDGPSQKQALQDFDQYNNENQNRLPANSNINEGEFYSRSSTICNTPTLVETIYDTPAASQQTYLSEESSASECEKKNNSDEMHRRQGTREPSERGIKIGSFLFTESIALETEYPVWNLSDSSDKVKVRDDIIPPSFSSCPRGNPSMSKCFQENLVTASGMAQQKPQTSGEFSRRWCENCGRYFMKELTFNAHKEDYCSNPRKPYKCGECGEIFPVITKLLLHKRMHTLEKPFKCTQCDYASARPDNLKNHMKTHTKK